MGRRGPPPKPTALRVLQGNPSKRPLNPAEPQPERTMPVCPSFLSAAAKREWRRIAPQLHAAGVLTRIDADALALYCQLFARWKAAEEFLAKNGEVYPLRDAQGNVRCLMPFPQATLLKSLIGQVRNLQQDFGLNPSSRSQIRVQAPESKSRLQLIREKSGA